MPTQNLSSTHRRFTLTLVAAFCLSLAACGGGGSEDEPASVSETPAAVDGMKSIAAVATTNTLLAGITIPGYPHKVDVYRPAGATKAVVFLHGHGGTSGQLAQNLGFNRTQAPVTAKNVNWDWLAANGIIAVFPQGQARPPSPLGTWSNYVFDSGQNDVAFLGALSAHVKAQYGATEVSLSGHSAGGVMTARMWCEGTTAYKAFVSMAGPMVSSAYPMPMPTTCTPLAPAPYYMLVGGKDTKLPVFTAGVTTPTPEQIAAGLTDSILTTEWLRHQGRAQRVCGETPVLSGSTVAATGPTWNACGGSVRYMVISNADHPIASLEQYAGVKMVDLIAGFVK